MIAQSLNRPMMSPPRMLSQQVQLEGSGVTRSPPLNNLTGNNDGHNHVDNDTNDHGFFTVRSLDRSTLLNFPAMQESHPLLDNSVDASTTPTHLSLYLNRETPRRGRRRRATSFDDLMPIPRIALKPRFSKLADRSSMLNPIHFSSSCRRSFSDDCSCIECLAAHVTPMPDAGRLRTENTNSTNRESPSRVERLRPRRATHFRHHTYGGSDSSSSNIFSEAAELERTDAILSSSHPLDQTVPIVHNSFELSQLQQNLPSGAKVFIAPRDALPTGRDISRPIPRHRRKRAAGDMSTQIPGSTALVRRQTSSTQQVHTASPSLGTPTCACTLSTSSASAFDQASPPQWQEQSPGNGRAHFQGLKVEPSSSGSQARDEGHEKKSSLPFDEVHFLMDQGEIDAENEDSNKQP